MAGQTTVRELLEDLLQYDMDDYVYVGLGQEAIPLGGSAVIGVERFSATIKRDAGVYICTIHGLLIED